MKKVYIITEFDMVLGKKEITACYLDKSLAKQSVDRLNDCVEEDSKIIYLLDSYPVSTEIIDD